MDGQVNKMESDPAPYMFKVMYRSGQSNGNADCLSRTPWPPMSANKFAVGEEGRNVKDRKPGNEDKNIHY